MQSINKLYVGVLLREHLQKRPNSKIAVRRNCFLSFCNYFNRYHVNQVTTEALKDWFQKQRSERNLTDSSLNKTRAGLNHFFKYLVEENIITTNPLAPIWFKGKHKKKRDRVILSPKEIKDMLQLMEEFSPDILYPFIFTLAHTGARLSEIRKLKWARVNFESNHIYLIHTKNGDERRIPMSPTLVDYLMELKERRGHKSEQVFLNQWNYLLSASQIGDMIIKFQKLNPDQKRWRCHDLRHGFAHNYLKKGGNMYALQAILGHRSIRMTIDLYGQLKAIDVEMINPYD
jgi:integrase